MSGAVDRIQTGIRMEKRLVKVLKALAELHDMATGEMVEFLVHHAFAGRIAFRGEGLAKIRELMGVYGLALTVPGLQSAAGQDERGE
jgi:hypothetical protein